MATQYTQYPFLLTAAADGTPAPAFTSLIGGIGPTGNIEALSVDGTGALIVSTVLTENAIFAIDSAFVLGSLSKLISGIRQDAAGPAAADGNIHPFLFNANGELKTASTFTEQAIYAEGSVFAPGSDAKLILAVRQDAAGPPVGVADGDVQTLLTDANGNLKVAGSFVESGLAADGAAAPAVGKMIGAFDGVNLQYVACDANGVLSEQATSVDAAAGLPAVVKVVAGYDGANVRTLSTDNTGKLNINASITGSSLTVVDFLDVPYFDATTINGSAGAFVQCVASLAANVTKVQTFDTSGSFMGVYVGPPAGEVLAFVFGPGTNETVDIVIPAGSRVSFRSLEAAAPVAGNITMNFIG